MANVVSAIANAAPVLLSACFLIFILVGFWRGLSNKPREQGPNDRNLHPGMWWLTRD
jgi:hypothetical protein